MFELERDHIATCCVCCGSFQLHKRPAILMPFVAHRAFDWRPVVIDESWGLSTIANGHAYSICNSLQCVDCELLFLDIRFSNAEMARLYKDYRGPEYEYLREYYEPGYSLRNKLLNDCAGYIDQVEDFLRPYLNIFPSVLDWGGDTGKNTPFKNSSKILDIYDISEKPTIPEARRVTKEMAKSESYDLIVCSQTLEHVPYPSDLLFDIKECMSDHTLLYIELPHERLMQGELATSSLEAKRHWHEHINFFAKSSLEKLISSCGFETIKIESIEIGVAGQTGSVFQALAKIKK